MKRFRSLISLKGNDHHEQVDKIVGDLHPSDATFPWDQIRDYTDIVVRKQKGITIPDGLDAFLSDFIILHPRKDIAIAACTHLLSRECILTLLAGPLQVPVGDLDALETFLNCIIAISHIKQTAIARDEALRAKEVLSVLPLAKEGGVEVLQPVISILVRGVPSSSLLAPHLVLLLETGARAQSHVLATLKASGQWALAHATSLWLTKLPAELPPFRNGYLMTDAILDGSLQHWRSWAAWRPHQQTLVLYASRLSATDRIPLIPLLALEGPAFGTNRYATLREMVSKTTASTKFQVLGVDFEVERCDPFHISTQLNRLTLSLIRVMIGGSTADHSKMTLFKRICLGRPINEAGLHVLEASIPGQQTSTIVAIQELLQAFDEGRDPKYSELLALLKFFSQERGGSIDQLFGSRVRASLATVFKKEQMSFKKETLVQRPWSRREYNLLLELHGIGKSLSDSASILEEMDSDQKVILKQWPEWWQVDVCYSILIQSQTQTLGAVNSLSKKIAGYLIERMVNPNSLPTDALRLVESLMGLWKTDPSVHCRTVAILVSKVPAITTFFRCRCIETLTQMPDEDVKTIRTFLENMEGIGDACTAFARYLMCMPDYIEFWSELLLRMVEQGGKYLVRWALETLSSKAWLTFVDDLANIFTNNIPCDESFKSPFLGLQLHKWSLVLNQHAEVLKRMEEENSMKSSPAIQCLLLGGALEAAEDKVASLQRDLREIMILVGTQPRGSISVIKRKIAARLTVDGKNARAVRRALVQAASATADGEEALLHVLNVYEEVSPEVAEMMLVCWHGEKDLMPLDQVALEVLGAVFGLDISDDVPLDSLHATEAWFQSQYEELLAEATRLESLRVAFKNVAPEETAKMLKELGIEDAAPVDDLLKDLSPDLINVVEKVADNEVEISIPLEKLTALQRKAMGAGIAKNLLLRFSPGYTDMIPGFCMHWDSEERSDLLVHSPCLILKDIFEEHACFGRMTPAIFQLSRLLSEDLRQNGFTTLTHLYTFLLEEMRILSSKCMVCGVRHGHNLRRSTVCIDPACVAAFLAAHVEIRLIDIRIDPAVVDLLLTTIYSAACQSNQTLLAGCPITSPQRIKYVIDNIPAITIWQGSSDLSGTLESLDLFQSISADANEILHWACNNYKGFLSSVTPNLKIPSLPGAHQFVLANASPSQEIAFATSVVSSGLTTKIMFHGTTMDRLHAILQGGLQDLSTTPLQRNGHAYGRGIYLSSEPSTAWGYTTPSTSWKSSVFANHRVLLGVEVAGNWPAASGHIHVITNPASVMVRFVFLMPNNASIPIANHVVPAMLSVCNGLRSGAL